MRTYLAILFFALFTALPSIGFAATEALLEIPTKEKAVNFGAVYITQWLYYLVNQNDEVINHGSFKNWTHYPFHPHLDKDGFDYNILKHAAVGNYYYLFYRSRGYEKKQSFYWAFASSLAFEFTIETVTERPSYQDIYQTPVFGTMVGIGVENASQYLHATDKWWGHLLGYILNPFTLLPETSSLVAIPMIQKDGVVAYVEWEF